jgi:two-component system chemotaxis sensor kinase CheA
VHDHEELVIKPASPAVTAAGIYGGMSLPDSGVPMLMLDAAGIAARAGIKPEESDPIAALTSDATADSESEFTSTLLFRDLAGRRLGVRLGVVERLEDVPADRIADTAGQLRVAIDGRLLPLAGADMPDFAGASAVKLLRLSDGACELAYAIDDVIDIVQLPPSVQPASSEGPIAGVALVDGEQVELIDLFWLFAQAGAVPLKEERPLCLLADADDRWSREILRPLLEAAGYRVGFAGSDLLEEPDVVIAGSAAPEGGDAPVIRLRPDMAGINDGSIYRYDRMGLLAAIENQMAKRRA